MKNARKWFFQALDFIWTSAQNLALTFFGLIIFTSPVGFNNLQATSDQLLFWQAMGAALAGAGLTNIVHHWWGINSNREMNERLERIEEQQKQIIDKLDLLASKNDHYLNERVAKLTQPNEITVVRLKNKILLTSALQKRVSVRDNL